MAGLTPMARLVDWARAEMGYCLWGLCLFGSRVTGLAFGEAGWVLRYLCAGPRCRSLRAYRCLYTRLSAAD